MSTNQKLHPGGPWRSRLARNAQGTQNCLESMLANNSKEKQWKNMKFNCFPKQRNPDTIWARFRGANLRLFWKPRSF